MKSRKADLPTEGRFYLTPAGVGIAIICFFLPWGKFSCVGLHKSVSGAELGGSFWLVFWCALAALLVGGVLVALRREAQARMVVLACSVFAFWILVQNGIRLSRGLSTPLGHIRPEHIGVSPRPGGVGTLLGFVVAAAGSFLLRSRGEPAPAGAGAMAPTSPDDLSGLDASRR